MSQPLPAWLKAKSLVSVHRADVDDHGIQGFLVGLSESLLALAYVRDFQVDGLTVLRRADITEVRRTGTDEFQERLMRQEGLAPGSLASVPLALDGWRPLIEQLAQLHPLMILERELGPAPEFSIGRPRRITAAQVEFLHFDGTGHWHTKADRLKYAQLTSLQVGTRYLGFYERHFERSHRTAEAAG